MVQVPTEPVNVTKEPSVPEVVQVPGVNEVNTTALPDAPPLAVTVSGAALVGLSTRAANTMVWLVALTICCTSGLGAAGRAGGCRLAATCLILGAGVVSRAVRRGGRRPGDSGGPGGWGYCTGGFAREVNLVWDEGERRGVRGFNRL